MKRLLQALLAAALLPCALAARAQAAPTPEGIAARAEAAKRLAGSDLAGLTALCNPAPAQRGGQAETEKYIAAQIARPAPPPGQAFENLYFVGAAWSSAWALTTPEGIVLFDALNNEAEATTLIEGGLRKLGLDPSQLKYVIVSHGHGDHYGGAPYLVQRFKPRVVMSEADWKMTETALEFATPLWGPVPKRDLAVVGGDRIVLGGTQVSFHHTPGHTWGTLTPVFDVRGTDGPHKVMLWGGTSFNFGRDIPRMDAYIEAADRMARLAQDQGVDVLLSNHANFDGTVAKFAARASAGGGAANPFVMGTPNVVRALTVMGECARAQRDRFLLAP